MDSDHVGGDQDRSSSDLYVRGSSAQHTATPPSWRMRPISRHLSRPWCHRSRFGACSTPAQIRACDGSQWWLSPRACGWGSSSDYAGSISTSSAAVSTSVAPSSGPVGSTRQLSRRAPPAGAWRPSPMLPWRRYAKSTKPQLKLSSQPVGAGTSRSPIWFSPRPQDSLETAPASSTYSRTLYSGRACLGSAGMIFEPPTVRCCSRAEQISRWSAGSWDTPAWRSPAATMAGSSMLSSWTPPTGSDGCCSGRAKGRIA